MYVCMYVCMYLYVYVRGVCSYASVQTTARRTDRGRKTPRWATLLTHTACVCGTCSSSSSSNDNRVQMNTSSLSLSLTLSLPSTSNMPFISAHDLSMPRGWKPPRGSRCRFGTDCLFSSCSLSIWVKPERGCVSSGHMDGHTVDEAGQGSRD
jgi:hypothetical protein